MRVKQPLVEARQALRDLMSELSEDACCASWHYDTEYRLWELLKHGRGGWMALGENDPRLAELRRLHELTGGWWWWNPNRGDFLGEKEFLLTAAWEGTYARLVDDKERAIFAVIGGKALRGEAALKATAELLRPLLKRCQP
jgi:hypothetical protein